MYTQPNIITHMYRSHTNISIYIELVFFMKIFSYVYFVDCIIYFFVGASYFCIYNLMLVYLKKKKYFYGKNVFGDFFFFFLRERGLSVK